jgi:hypothetical protein
MHLFKFLPTACEKLQILGRMELTEVPVISQALSKFGREFRGNAPWSGEILVAKNFYVCELQSRDPGKRGVHR